MTNPLVAQREDSTKSFSGVPILESVDETKKAIESGDWAAGVMGSVGTGLDALGMALDPFGAIFSAGVGWLIEHVGPVSDALDSLTGDPDQIKAHSETWKNVSAELEAINTEMKDLVKADTASWLGEAGDAYRKRSEDTANLIAAAKSAADGAAEGIGTAGEVVGAVRSLVRDIIAELVGHLISWALQVVCTLGIAMAWVVPQVVAEVAKVAAKIADITTKLVKAMKALSPLLKKLGDSFGETKKALDQIKKDNGKNDGPASTNAQSADDKSRGGQGGDSGKPEGTRDDGGKGDGAASTNSASTRGSRGGTRSIRDDNPDPHKNSNPAKHQSTSGDPVDVATGRMLLRQHDVSLTGVLPLVLSRTHVSGYRQGRHFGAAWASTVDQRLEVASDGIHFAVDDGTFLSYPMPGDEGPVFPVSGPRWPLHRAGDGGFVIANHELDQVWHFAATGTGDLPLRTVMDGNGNRVDIDRDADGTPTALRHSAGHQVIVRSQNGLVRALWLDDEADGVELVRYVYDSRGDLTEVYNSSGQPLRFEYDSAGRIVRWDDRNGMWYRYEFDAQGRCVSSTGKDGYLDCTFEYDTERRQTRTTDSLGQVTVFQLDERWRVVGYTDPLGNTTRAEWDEQGNLIARTDPLGRTTRFRYDDLGNVVALIHPDGSQVVTTFDEDRRPITITTEDGAVWQRQYDSRGRVAAEIDPGGGRTMYSYDEAGNLARITDALGNITRIESDVNGQPLTVTDPTGGVTRYAYDRFGRRTSVVDAAGDVTRYAWTVEGALRSRLDPDGRTWHWRRDAEGNLREAATAERSVRTEVGHFDLPASIVDANGSQIGYAYDTELRLVRVVNEHQQTWTYTYDAAGNLTAETDFDGRVTRYRYDAAGQLVERINAAGQSVRYRYDVRGRLVEHISGDTATHFAYDLIGRMRSARNDHAELHFDYEHTPAGKRMVETVNGRSVVSEYDQLGRRVLRRLPSGAESKWEYDQVGRPVALETAGRVIEFSFDRQGREIERHIGPGLVLRNQWDLRNRLCAQEVVNRATGQPVQHRSFGYSETGGLVGVTDKIAGTRRFDLDAAGRVVAVSGPNWQERYAYDTAGNLRHAEIPGGSPHAGPREYVGALVRRAGGTRYDHDVEGRVSGRHHVTSAGQIESWRYSWDADDRLVAVTTPDGSEWRYLYDPLGRRIAKQRLAADGVSVKELIEFTWDGTELVEQVHNGTNGMSWDRLPGADAPICQVERAFADAQRGWVDTNFYAIVTDLVGTPQELIDPNGHVAWHALNTVWGSDVRQAGTATTPLRFPGQYYDGETGLHYNFYRYYDPSVARYLSRDPLGMLAGPNARSYVPNPTTMSDPLGLFMCVQSEAEELADMAKRNNFPTGMAAALRPNGRNVNEVFYGFSGRGNHDIRFQGGRGGRGNYAENERLDNRRPNQNSDQPGTTILPDRAARPHPNLAQALENVPQNRRAPNAQHGGCAEMDALNQALHDGRGRPLTGNALQARLNDLQGSQVGVAGVGDGARQGRYFPPCTSCDHVLQQFGVKPSGYTNPGLLPRESNVNPLSSPPPASGGNAAGASAPPPSSGPSGQSWANIARGR
ncbi:RHS repeat-associated core domain-containing protein [Saccharopolyspora mangrovi]|uniref:RHS repeat-associated core domain-containing protein n=1 Tax=Saccharopolyspora mangrovi TaxID=3082379 RepID=A0ABU6A911_9PSEU|nr:RHS repeat-associated core domain-containing protein [Saccharopolyspora sp. S2-29]MEB3368020.1 RHS repeat-associated core domain-containing protein [Saccharopolyspora sp. S2-29]